ncbi:hypothetical protein [Tessaracoccus rhinocerotis]|nr:hypothetical protein [Tessaracoccus rhinocerotis]
MSTTTPRGRPTRTPRTGPPPTDPGRATRGWRTLLVVLGGLSMLSGLNAALVRLGVWAPVASERVGDLHGPVMVLGFMGTLISLERAQALRNSLAYLAPALLGLGSILLVAGAPQYLGKLLLFDGTVAFVVLALALWLRAPLGLVAAQVLGALMAALAAGLWLVVEIAALVPLLAAFLVVTIAAERAELAQLTMGRRAVPTLLAMGSLLALSASLAVVAPQVGGRIFGAACLVTALWLFRDDVGRRMVRADGLRRFNAVSLLAGNFWLAVAGIVWIVVGQPAGRGAYDITIHGVFLGFGLSMIIAHAPIIFPAVLGRPLPYRPVMWVPLGVLHVGMVVRALGDLTGIDALFKSGGIVTVTSLLLFAAAVVSSVVKR